MVQTRNLRPLVYLFQTGKVVVKLSTSETSPEWMASSLRKDPRWPAGALIESLSIPVGTWEMLEVGPEDTLVHRINLCLLKGE